ncbi:RNA polymerase sigma factor [Mongoliitalea daihaiensis]|jgi:RNA polymerase sigma-70 factor, ECF subfamily|uniref:RNA polymerase sigma factor n=1 Tax=Mongoliitalea daihaiensis TaxID=2782006 RepID=UPI001F256B6A|nr:RNA polymerase sigma factor [Mongoliitalea daihaiensis]UJP66392.1 RNA polymerase sigma factor [Mongoliitalea daihaiensis]
MDEKEFLQLINTHQGTIFHLLRLYVSDATDRDDLKQEIVLQAWKSRDKFRQDSSFNTWLYKLSLYTILTSKRKQQKISQVNLEEAEGLAYADKPDQEQVELLYRCISVLDDLNKTIITMHLDGFSNAEIAVFMGVTVNNLTVKLHRIKEKITNYLKAAAHGD